MSEDGFQRDARRSFLLELIDHAGLFPPASLPLDEAVADYRESRAGPNGWVLGRFLSPASRLDALARAIEQAPDEEAWRLGVVLDRTPDAPWSASAGAGLEALHRFREQAGPRASVEFVEVALPSNTAAAVDEAAGVLLSSSLEGVALFLELPAWQAGGSIAGTMESVAALDPRQSVAPGVKIRCGGPTAGSFPEPEQVAAFLHHALRLGRRVKTTAGLHHPFRHVDGATGFVQHGFVNLVGAVVLGLTHKLDEDTIAKVIADDEPGHFSLTRDGFAWQDLSAGPEEIRAARRTFVAFGSCSFAEPVEDLEAIGVLPLERS